MIFLLASQGGRIVEENSKRLVWLDESSQKVESFGYAQDKSFDYAQDKSFGYAQDKSFGYAQDKSFGTSTSSVHPLRSGQVLRHFDKLSAPLRSGQVLRHFDKLSAPLRSGQVPED
jgi:hypothetical protein